MEGQRIRLNDGTVYENARAGSSSGFLWLWIPGISIQEAAQTALDTQKTARIVFEYGEMSDIYEGFTVCRTIMTDGEEASICLTREAE